MTPDDDTPLPPTHQRVAHALAIAGIVLIEPKALRTNPRRVLRRRLIGHASVPLIVAAARQAQKRGIVAPEDIDVKAAVPVVAIAGGTTVALAAVVGRRTTLTPRRAQVGTAVILAGQAAILAQLPGYRAAIHRAFDRVRRVRAALEADAVWSAEVAAMMRQDDRDYTAMLDGRYLR